MLIYQEKTRLSRVTGFTENNNTYQVSKGNIIWLNNGKEANQLSHNILEVTCFNLKYPGGIPSNLRNLEKGLTGLGNRVFISGMKDSLIDKVLVYLKYFGSENSFFYNFRCLLERQAKKTIKFIDAMQIDIINCHDVAICSFLLDRTNKPIILTIHGPFSKEIEMYGLGGTLYHKAIIEMEKKCYSDKRLLFIAVDSGQKNILTQEFNVDPEKIFVIFNSVDTLKFHPLDPPEKGNYVLVPRRLVMKNGCHIAIEALKYIDKEIRIVFAGDGPKKHELISLSRKLGVKDRVEFLGSLPNDKILELMQRALAVIIPSIPSSGVIEASSIAMLEGMSVGKPVIASAIGGMKEIISDGETGILVEPGNKTQLADSVNWVINNPNKADEMGNRARSYVIKNHSPSNQAERYLEVYYRAISFNNVHMMAESYKGH